jgi:hypothetical protein
MTIKVAKTALGHKSGEAVSLNFKWADNADIRGDIMAFMELGDTAPNDRFVFSYTASTTEDERDTTEETESDTAAEAPTDGDTAEPTAPVTEAPTDPVTEPPKRKGCKSAVSVSAGILTAAVLGIVPCIKRKKKHE